MIKKNVVFLVAAVMLVTAMTAGCSFNVGTPSPTPSPSLTNTYESPEGYTIKYSSDWTLAEAQDDTVAAVFVLPTKNVSENFNIQVYDLEEDDTLSSIAAANLEDIKTSFDNFKQIEAGNTTLAGAPAYKVVYTADIDGNSLKLMQLVTVKDDAVYMITYKAPPGNFNKYLSTAQQMIDSFTIV